MLYRPTFTKPIPAGAELFTRKGERFACYTDGRGKTKIAKVTTNEHGVDRLVFTSPYWRVRYRDGSGVECDVPTGIQKDSLSRFVHRRQSLRLDIVDRLSARFRLELAKKEK